jgi:phosphate-selective porin OprO and OprP
MSHPTLLLPSPNKAKLLSAVALGAPMIFDISAAKADSIRDEIRQLKAEIKRLEAKAARQEQQIRGVAKFPKMPPLADVPVVCKNAPCPPPPPPILVSFVNGLQVDSWDDAFSFRIGGRVLVDGGVNSQPVGAFPPPGITLPAGVRPYLPSHPGFGFSNQVGFRQVRLEVLGKAFMIGNISFSMISMVHRTGSLLAE